MSILTKRLKESIEALETQIKYDQHKLKVLSWYKFKKRAVVREEVRRKRNIIRTLNKTIKRHER